MKKESRVQITNEVRDELIAERDRTGIGVSALLKNSRKEIPAGLNYVMVSQWMAGRITSARKDHLDYVLAKWRAISEGDCRIPITPELIQELKALQCKTGISPARLLKCYPPPEGLTSQIITRWIAGLILKGRRGHINFVLEAWKKIPVTGYKH